MASVRAAFTATLPALGRAAPARRLAAAAAAARPARAAVAAASRRGGATMAAAAGSLADLGTVPDIDGGPLPLAGRPTFVVNVASECGYTASGYQQMKDVLAKYGDRVAVVAVPCNAFGMQEPGSADQIKSFVASRAPGVLIAPKSAVNGAEAHPLFAVGKTAFPGDCGWNFACRFLYDKDGKPVARFDNASSLTDVTAAIDPLL
ncbi:hypothetical protein BU14_0027s0004 [Porphyra umbilicalis]|uniref:Glutathione peroxidase n=1 Tax=Porphyra umbilicalis TaxID=2786 RepID=A0A1X6PJU2_PORUM|nr:hypothetical protein BU14_0027s0004 [Porphyra umbilicalis]|eukprot:OSX80978.1 hypothetical protein BU14_0027s0004 [Porphyra umbilicalis]